MPVHDDLGKRMKENYEMRARTSLVRRMPVAIRIDGKAFHTFTKHLNKPFDSILMTAMEDTMKKLCQNIQGCVFGYTQSDEITLVLIDYQKLTSSAWFDYEVQKMTSISASMATLYFNKSFCKQVDEWIDAYCEAWNTTDKDDAYLKTLNDCCQTGAMFDARVFNIPKEEVTNLIYWRQLDATRNSIQSVGQYYFSHNRLHGKSCNQIQEMLWQEHGINWNTCFPTSCKRGTACYKHPDYGWILDSNMPILTGDNREYVEKHIRFESA